MRRILLPSVLVALSFLLVARGQTNEVDVICWYLAPLRVTIGVPVNNQGVRAVGDQEGIRFPIVIQNISDTPIKIWGEYGRLGYGIVRLEVTKVDKKPLPMPIIVKKDMTSWILDNDVASATMDSETIEPHESTVREVLINIPRTDPLGKPLSYSVADAPYFGMPLPKPGGQMTLTISAVLTISSREGDPMSHGVWAGQVSSPARDYVIYRHDDSVPAEKP